MTKKPVVLTEKQIRLLQAIQENPNAPSGHLIKKAGIISQEVKGLREELVAEGLIEVSTEQAYKGRRIICRLTSAGEGVLKSLAKT